MKRTTDVLIPCKCATCRFRVSPMVLWLIALVAVLVISAVGFARDWKW